MEDLTRFVRERCQDLLSLIRAENLPARFMKNLNLSFEELAIDESKVSDEDIKEFSLQAQLRSIFAHAKSKSHYTNQQKTYFRKLIYSRCAKESN